MNDACPWVSSTGRARLLLTGVSLGYWGYREELSRAHKLRRVYYEVLRDDLDEFVLQYGLVESYENFKKNNMDYPFVERREMKPRARVPGVEYEEINAFLIIFVEDTIPAACKKYIRFFDVNKTVKSNLIASGVLDLSDEFDRGWKYLDSIKFSEFLRKMLPVDYALLIQRDPVSRASDRYALSHYHVRIDWPISEAAEEMGKDLRYIIKDLYERGDKCAEDIQKKFFEMYGLPLMAGGRRTAASVAAQYLKRLNAISTVYVSSSESRCVLRFSERGISRYTLVRFTLAEMLEVSEENSMNLETFTSNYVIDYAEKDGVCILRVDYDHTPPARPPQDGKIRAIKADTSWTTITNQLIMPRPGIWKYPLLKVNVVYT